jgi:hypothetical protein
MPVQNRLKAMRQDIRRQTGPNAAGRAIRPLLLACLMLIPAAGARCPAQNRNPFPPEFGQPSDGQNGGPLDTEKVLKALNAERQKSMVSDTNKLLRLTKELNTEIAASNPGEFTPEQLHMMAEIEKLAHSIKEKMATSVRGTPPFTQLPMLTH